MAGAFTHLMVCQVAAKSREINILLQYCCPEAKERDHL